MTRRMQSLSYTEKSVTLCEVAADFPELSWAEAFTAAKLIANGTGWHVGAMVGSPDFIADLNEVKGKTDAGFVAPMAAGVIAALETDQEGIARCREMYRRRLRVLIDADAQPWHAIGYRAARWFLYPVAGAELCLWAAHGECRSL